MIKKKDNKLKRREQKAKGKNQADEKQREQNNDYNNAINFVIYNKLIEIFLFVIDRISFLFS